MPKQRVKEQNNKRNRTIRTYIWKPFCIFSERFSSAVVLSLLILRSMQSQFFGNCRNYLPIEIILRVPVLNQTRCECKMMNLIETNCTFVVFCCVFVYNGRTVICQKCCRTFEPSDGCSMRAMRKCWIAAIAATRTIQMYHKTFLSSWINAVTLSDTSTWNRKWLNLDEMVDYTFLNR